MPPGGDVGQQADQVHPEGVEQGVGDDDRDEEQERVRRGRLDAPHQVAERHPGGGAAEVDRGGHRDLAEQVEPADVPRPHALVPLGQPARPVVEAARGRVLRAHLAHRQRDAGDQQSDDQPAEHDGRGAAGAQRDAVGGDRAGQDRDDREGDREVGERGHAAVQLLLVAHLGEDAGVVVEVVGGLR